jgi:hypothetical protein
MNLELNLWKTIASSVKKNQAANILVRNYELSTQDLLNKNIEEFDSAQINNIEDLENFLEKWNKNDKNCALMCEKLMEYRIKLLLNLKKVYRYLYNYYLNGDDNKKVVRGKIGEKISNVLKITRRDERKKLLQILSN